MSTCPDKIVISEYFDGELPSPWKEKLQGHIADCNECDKSYKQYNTVSKILNKDTAEKLASFDYSASFEKLKTKLNSTRAVNVSGAVERVIESDTTDRSFWQRSIKLPMPIVAAAVLAFLFLPAFLYFALTQPRSLPQGQPQHGVAYQVFQASPNYKYPTATNTGNIGNVNFNSDIDSFIRLYMPNQQQTGVIISLPAHIFNQDAYTEYFQHVPVIETNQ